MNLKLQNITHLFKNVRTRTILIVTVLILLVGLLVGIGRFINKTPAADSSIQLKDSPNLQSIPGGIDRSPSADYQRLQEQQNLQQAALAEKTGASAIPTLLDTSQFNQSQANPFATNAACKACCCCTNSSAENQLSSQSGASWLQPSYLRAGTLVYDAHGGSVIGRLRADGKVRNKDGEIIGQVGPDGLVRSAEEGSVIGSAAVPAVGDPVYDATGQLIGEVGADGEVQGRVRGVVAADGTVRDYKDRVIGKVGANGIVQAINGKTIGRTYVKAVPGSPVYDRQDKLIGTVGTDRHVRDSQGNVIGTLSRDGSVHGLDQAVLGNVGSTAPGTPIYDRQGRLVGTVATDGIVRDSQGREIARLGSGGIARDKQGNDLGSTTAPVSQSAASLNSSLGNMTAPAVSLLSGPSDTPNPELQAILDRQAQQISAQKAEQLQQQMQSSMATQASQLFVAWGSPTQQYVSGVPPLSTEQTVGGGASGGSLVGSTAAPAVKAGTIMYAVLLTAVNSDEPGPVMAEIVQGKFKGARLLGALSNQGKKVLLSFNTLTLPKLAQSLRINTVAIDESTARTALSSYTNNHYWLRYGTLFGSAFLQGYGQSFLNAGSPYAGAVIINPKALPQPDLKPRDRVFVGLGQVGLQYASALGSVFSTPPTVHVYSGTPMGILFLTDLAALPPESSE